MEQVRKILLAGRLRDEVREYLARQQRGFEFRVGDYHEIGQEDLEWADVYVAFRPVEGLDMGAVKWVHALGAGVDFYLFRRKWPAGTLLTKTPGNFGRKIGEYCLTRALMLKQRIPELMEDQKARRWEPKYAELLAGDRVLVVGTGNVGRGIGGLFKAVGCYVEGISQDDTKLEQFERIYKPGDLAERVVEADWIILAVPLTEETYMLFGRSVMERCTGGCLINVARGPVVDEEALVEALRAGRLGGAALDVFVEEPLRAESPLWEMPNVLISPHIAAITSAEEAGESFLGCLRELAKGQRPQLAVDTDRGY